MKYNLCIMNIGAHLDGLVVCNKRVSGAQQKAYLINCQPFFSYLVFMKFSFAAGAGQANFGSVCQPESGQPLRYRYALIKICCVFFFHGIVLVCTEFLGINKILTRHKA